jgi:hypothetical protein
MIEKNDDRLKTGEFKIFWKDRKHSLKAIQKMKETHEKNGLQKGEKNSQFGTCLIYNLDLKKCKRIKKEELNKWQILGWKQGAKFKWN